VKLPLFLLTLPCPYPSMPRFTTLEHKYYCYMTRLEFYYKLKNCHEGLGIIVLFLLPLNSAQCWNIISHVRVAAVLTGDILPWFSRVCDENFQRYYVILFPYQLCHPLRAELFLFFLSRRWPEVARFPSWIGVMAIGEDHGQWLGFKGKQGKIVSLGKGNRNGLNNLLCVAMG